MRFSSIVRPAVHSEHYTVLNTIGLLIDELKKSVDELPDNKDRINYESTLDDLESKRLEAINVFDRFWR